MLRESMVSDRAERALGELACRSFTERSLPEWLAAVVGALLKHDLPLARAFVQILDPADGLLTIVAVWSAGPTEIRAGMRLRQFASSFASDDSSAVGDTSASSPPFKAMDFTSSRNRASCLSGP